MLLLHGPLATSAVEFQGTYLNSDSQSVYTFADVPIGPASPERVIVVIVYAERPNPGDSSDYTVYEISVGGQTADWLTYVNKTLSARELWGVTVGEGTTADITVELSSAADFCEIAVFSLYNMAFNFYGDYFYSNFAFPTAVDSTTFTCKIFEGGVFIFAHEGSRTFTGFDANFSGTHISGGYMLAQQYEAARTFTASSALPTNYRFGGSWSFGP